MPAVSGSTIPPGIPQPATRVLTGRIPPDFIMVLVEFFPEPFISWAITPELTGFATPGGIENH